MKKIQGIIFSMAAFLLSSMVLFGQTEDNRILITLDGDPVTAGEFMRVYEKNNMNKEQGPDAISEYLELYINFRLKVKEAMELGLDTLASFRKELEGYRKQLAQPYFTDDSVKAQLLREAYERSKYDIRASHILLRVDRYADPADTLAVYNKIMGIRDRIFNGEGFGIVAQEVSEDPSARDTPASQYRPARKGNKGDLGYFTVFDMVYPFETGAYNTPVGDVSMPVRTDYGYHLIKVTDRQPALGQVQVAHIYISIPPNATKADSTQKEIMIKAAYEQLQNGVDFADVVREYSEDRASVNNGGKLPWFGANRMVPDFVNATRNLKDSGDYSAPFMTQFGWHIVQLIGRKGIGTFDEEKNTLQAKLDKDQRIEKAQDVVIVRIKKDYGFKEFPKAKNALQAVMDTTLKSGTWSIDKAEGMNKTLFSIGNMKYTQADLARYISEKQNSRITSVDQFFNQSYATFVKEKCLAYEDSKLEEKYPDFRMLMNEYHDGILLFDLTDQKVWSKAVKDTAGLKEFYESNKGNYMWGKRLDATLFTFLDNSAPDPVEVAELAGNGWKVQDILDKFNSDTVMLLSAESGKYSLGDNAVVDEIEWKAGPSAVVNTGAGPAMAYVYAVLDPEPKTLDESRGLVTADYQAYLEAEWIKELRNKYTVTIDESVLSTLP